MTAPDNFLNIRYETLQQAQVDLSSAVDACENAINDLIAQLDRHLNPDTREGSAYEIYLQNKQSWHDHISQMKDVLTQAGVHIGNAHDMYVQVERQNTSIWHS